MVSLQGGGARRKIKRAPGRGDQARFSSGTSSPAGASAEVSSKPPTWVSPMNTCGTVRRPPERAIISSCFAGSRSMRIFSISVTPRLLSRRSAATQYGHTAVQYITTLAIKNSLFLGDGQVGAFPRDDAPRLVVYGLEAGFLQDAAGSRRAVAAAAGDQDRLGLEFVEFLEAFGELSKRNVPGPGNVSGGVFLVLAHVEYQGVVVVEAGGLQRVGLFHAGELAADEGPGQHDARNQRQCHQHPVLLQELHVHECSQLRGRS